MADRWWSDDDHLLDALREAMRSGPVPPGFVEAGKAAFRAYGIDAQYAALVYDSAVDLEPAGTRAEQAVLRQLGYRATNLQIELEFGDGALHVQLVPGQLGTVRVVLQSGDALATMTTNQVGYVRVEPPPPTPFRLLCCTVGGIPVVTGWVPG